LSARSKLHFIGRFSSSAGFGLGAGRLRPVRDVPSISGRIECQLHQESKHWRAGLADTARNDILLDICDPEATRE